jgi:hypothetical protein
LQVLGADATRSGGFGGIGHGVHDPELVDADVADGFAELGFELGEYVGRFDAGKNVDDGGEFVGADSRIKIQPANARSGQHGSQVAFSRATGERDAVEHQFVAGNGERQLGAVGQRSAQFVPGGIELRRGTLVFQTIESGLLEQDIATAHEGARRG